MELQQVSNNIIPRVINNFRQSKEIPEFTVKPFVEANTVKTNLNHLKNDCIIPVFSKDNEKTIAHQEFIEAVQESVAKSFQGETIQKPEIRVSHQIKGRVPSAIHKSAKELLEHERTVYYERMAFIIRIPSIVTTIDGNKIALTVGGVRAYNQQNLYSKKTYEKFKFFIGYQNLVCCNLCISSDGYVEELKADSYVNMLAKITEVIENYNAEQHITTLKDLTNYDLTEHQFAQLIGRARLYNYLPKKIKNVVPNLFLNDGQLSTVAKDYYKDDAFCKNESGDINLWKLYNLFTQANKSSYIDTFLNRNVNAFDFSKGLTKALNGNENYHWFLS